MTNATQTLNSMQIETIIDKIVPIIAAPEDREFFRGVLFCKLESCESSAKAAVFISNLLKTAEMQ